MNLAEKKQLVSAVPSWFHSHDFGDGIVASGIKPLQQLRAEWDQLLLPDLAGATVLDINSWDGWFALEAERRGASRVVGLDWYMWSMDQAEHARYYRENRDAGTTPQPYHLMPYFRPNELPGKKGFDTARLVSGSHVEEIVGDFATMSLDTLRGSFDIVLYLGTLYHMADPLGNLRRLYEVTAPGGLAVIETHAVVIEGFEHVPLCENYGPLHSLNADSSNWWSPNELALRQMLLAVGFEDARIVSKPPTQTSSPASRRNALRTLLPSPLKSLVSPRPVRGSVHEYRAYAHARRSSESTTRPSSVPSQGISNDQALSPPV